MIDKDQQGPILLMIREFYQPVMMRAFVNLVMIDISQITLGAPHIDVKKILGTDKCQKALMQSLDEYHRPRKHDLIDEIIRQYGLALRKDELDFYHEKMGAMADEIIDYLQGLIKVFNYKHLYNLSKGTMN